MGIYLPKLIGVCGKKGSGKDTSIKKLVEQYDYKVIKFAGHLKDMMRALLKAQNVSEYMIERMIEGDLKEVPSGYLAGRTPRYAMQTLGTEWGRDLIDKSFWTTCFVNQIDEKSNTRYVCTDMRFPNEVEVVKALGGYTYRVERENTSSAFAEHPSETLIGTLEVDEVIFNTRSIDDLQSLALLLTNRVGHDVINYPNINRVIVL